ncbi:MAG: hypothetical protein ACPGVD_07540 [Flavobacteriales bacterium]
MKRVIPFTLILFLFLTCTNKKEIDFTDYKGLVVSMVNLTDQTIERNNDLVKEVNGLYIRLLMLKMDPASTKTAKQMIPINDKVRLLSNETDNIFLNQINEIIEKEEGKKNWFLKNERNQINTYSSFYELKNVDSPKWTTELLGINSEESNKRAENLRVSLIKFRDKLILTVADSVLNDKNQLHIIGIDKLSNYDSFEFFLEQTNHPNKFELLKIYDVLTISQKIKFSDAEILWNRSAFQNQPLIGAIATLNYYRNKIRIVECIAGKMLLARIDKPLRPLHEYQE